MSDGNEDGADDLNRFGAAAAGDLGDDGDLDPSHLRALAVRIQQLAGLIDLQRAEGRRRDDHIKGVRNEVEEARKDIDKLDGDVKTLIRKQMTDEDRATMRAVMDSFTFKERAWKVVLRYSGYGAAIALFVWTFRDPLLKFFTALGKAGQ